MNGRSRNAYASSSEANVRSSAASPVSGWPSSSIRRKPFSDRLQPRSRARSRSRTLCSLEPVKWIRYVPASPGGMTIRSTCGPRISRTAALYPPRLTTESTSPNLVKRVDQRRPARSVSARRSRSPIDSCRRRYEPAGSMLADARRLPERLDQAVDQLLGVVQEHPPGPAHPIRAIPSRTSASVFAGHPALLAQPARSRPRAGRRPSRCRAPRGAGGRSSGRAPGSAGARRGPAGPPPGAGRRRPCARSSRARGSCR